ncbi:maleylpyruvate isomerase family mycothiol-dependent enzyme [Glutamicibacter sp.]|uniref:maleylpyruvate isomerase family mycothiol-dependent enzyme n=1 Tax=Glutamicibacter sp. TaxID=1931995 RepID=UPI0028BEAAD5|nr:maleylpyruvate isomerase family mycothiol-dependent enzyme [Glutamicibacter sp.]
MSDSTAQHIWDLVHDERRALITDLSTLNQEQWNGASDAAGWSVHDVAAHLVDNALTTGPRLFRAMLRAGFNFDRQNANGVAAQRAATPEQTLEGLKAAAASRTGPPAPLASRLVEEIAHGEDIRRAVGIRRDYPVQALEYAIRYQAGTPQAFSGTKELAQRVQLVSDDERFSMGLGPRIMGTRLALLMVLSGRTVDAAELSGPGLAYLPPWQLIRTGQVVLNHP